MEKYDPNTEAFQMRAQWKKAEICKNLWYDNWSWLLDERKQAIQESDVIRHKAAASLPKKVRTLDTDKSLKPVPVTSTGFVGWLSTKSDCQLEIYASWLDKPPVHLHDAWDYKDYISHP